MMAWRRTAGGFFKLFIILSVLSDPRGVMPSLSLLQLRKGVREGGKKRGGREEEPPMNLFC